MTYPRPSCIQNCLVRKFSFLLFHDHYKKKLHVYDFKIELDETNRILTCLNVAHIANERSERFSRVNMDDKTEILGLRLAEPFRYSTGWAVLSKTLLKHEPTGEGGSRTSSTLPLHQIKQSIRPFRRKPQRTKVALLELYLVT